MFLQECDGSGPRIAGCEGIPGQVLKFEEAVRGVWIDVIFESLPELLHGRLGRLRRGCDAGVVLAVEGQHGRLNPSQQILARHLELFALSIERLWLVGVRDGDGGSFLPHSIPAL